MKKIDFEAHFYNKEYIEALTANKDFPRLELDDQLQERRLWYAAEVGQPFGGPLYDALLDPGEKRLAAMDGCGVDIQALSLAAPGIEQLPPATGCAVAEESNNALAAFIKKSPDRFMGYAALAPKHPEQAVVELERAVKELGFIGWNTHSNFGDAYLDEKRFWPILGKAAELGVPVYLHPTVPAIPAVRTYGFALGGAPFGFGMETAMCMMRLIYSGVFDEYPDLKIILGHLGETLPFLIERIDWAWVRPFNPKARPQIAKRPSEYLKTNVWVSTSGNYYEPAFKCTVEALGIDRIILGTDYPYEDASDCMDFIAGMNLSQEDQDKIYFKNAERMGIPGFPAIR
jgi:predicted TIM-barrel fold metal-dependent hydrolase